MPQNVARSRGSAVTSVAPASQPAPNMIEQAHKDLQLTPQERGLYQRHLDNLNGSGKVVHDDGSISTLYQMSVQGPGNMTYNIPSVYEGKIVQPDEAMQRASQQGWHNFPAYATPEIAESRYQQMHSYMDQDVGHYLKSLQKVSP